MREKIQQAIKRLKAFEPHEGYYLAYSGGKGSDAIKILADLAGVKYKAYYSPTTVDAPETVEYIQSQKDIQFDPQFYHNGTQITMWNLIEKNEVPPTRLMRYCCKYLKENSGKGNLVVTGIRWSEGINRRKNSGLIKIFGKPKTTQELAENLGLYYKVSDKGGLILNDYSLGTIHLVNFCYREQKTTLNPIIDWSDSDVWQFLCQHKCTSNPLYQDGWKRIGCIGCPLAGKKRRLDQFEIYPEFKDAYINAFDNMLKVRNEKNRITHTNWKTGEAVFNWWIK